MATHYSILAWRIPMDRGGCQPTVHRVANSWTQLSNKVHHYYTYNSLIQEMFMYIQYKGVVLVIKIKETLPFSTTEMSLEGIMPSEIKVKVKVGQSCSTLRDPIDYTVHGILQARILKWVAFPFSRGSSQPRDRTQVSHIASGFFTS